MKAIKREAPICLALFLIALLPRLLSLDAFITWDEPMWTYRSIKFLSALRRLDFDATFLVGHPGVMTMWSGAAGISIQRLLGFGSATDLGWLSGLPTLDPRDSEALFKLAPFLSAAKLPLAVLNAACVVGIYLLAKRLFDARVALFAALLLALDPFHIALSRVLHIDALAANFMILSLLSMLVHLRQYRSRSYLLLSGTLAGLAFLSKAYALFLAPLAGLLLAAACLAKERDLRKAIPLLLSSFATWCLVAVLIFSLLWPAMWVDPLGTVQGVLDTAFGYAATPHATSKFFLGKMVADPGPWFYLVVLAFRTSPLTLLGLAIALPLLLGNEKAPKGNLAALLAYACLFTILMTLGAKKFDRYMLPSILALDIVAAWGLVELGRLVSQRLGRRSKFQAPNSKGRQLWTLDSSTEPSSRAQAEGLAEVLGLGTLVVLLLLQAGHILSYHPYYLSYYNPLLGGSPRAVQVLPVGWGEGMDLAARYLNQKKAAENLRVATWGIPGFAPLFKGQTEGLMEHNLATADYAVLYVSDVQQDSTGTTALYGQQQPEHVVNIHGVDYAWIYPNTHYRELIAYLESQARPDDIVLLDATSPFVKHYQGPLSYYVILDSQSWTEMADRLTESASPQRLWYVAYPGSNAGSWISYQLNTHALLIKQEALPHATVSGYLLTSPPALDSSPIKVQSDVNFGNLLRLTGYGFTEDVVEYRKSLGVTLHWQAQRGMEENYALSVRLVDGEGHLWAQEDKWLLSLSGLPTSAWEAGETSEGRYLLSIPPGVPPGRYQVKAIVYQTDTLERVAILDEGGRPAGMDYTLRTISVASPTVPPTIEELAIPHALSYDFNSQVELLGYGLSADEVGSGDTLGLTLFWRALRPMEQDYGLLIELRDEAGGTWMAAKLRVPNASYPTSRWQPGEILCAPYDLLIDAAVLPGPYGLFVNLLDGDGRRLIEEGFSLTELSIEGREHLFAVPEVRFPLWADIAHRAALLGYDLDWTSVEPGGVLHLTLYWQTLARMETSYTVFTHLLDAEGRVRGQKDSIPCGGACPTTSWLEGEVIVDRYEIVANPDGPPGEYQIEVGMYDAKTGERLPVFNEKGERLPEDRVLLESADAPQYIRPSEESTFGVDAYNVHLPIVSSGVGTQAQTAASQAAQCANKVHREENKLVYNGKEIRLIGVNATWMTRGRGFPEEKWDEVLSFLSKYVNCIRVWVFPGADVDRLERLLNLGAEYDLLFGITFETFQEVPEYARFGQTWFAEGYEETYLPFVKEVVNRFKGSSRIAFWQMMNEPNPWGWPWGRKGSGIDTFERWIEHVAAEIRAIDPCHPISIGLIRVDKIGDNVKPEKWFKEIHTSTEVDLVTAHVHAKDGKKEIDLANEIGYPIVFTEVWIDRSSNIEKRRYWVLRFAEERFDRGLAGLLLWQFKKPTQEYPWKYEITQDEIPVWEALREFH